MLLSAYETLEYSNFKSLVKYSIIYVAITVYTVGKNLNEFLYH